MLLGIPRSARCVQSFDDSLDSASRKTYRISLRSSSLWEPRYPSLKVVMVLQFFQGSPCSTRAAFSFQILGLIWCGGKAPGLAIPQTTYALTRRESVSATLASCEQQCMRCSSDNRTEGWKERHLSRQQQHKCTTHFGSLQKLLRSFPFSLLSPAGRAANSQT